MNQQTSLLGPVTGAERIRSLDVLRGVALLGILLMNITSFGPFEWLWRTLTYKQAQPFRRQS